MLERLANNLHVIADQIKKLVGEDTAWEVHAAGDRIMAAVDKERA